MTRRKMLCMAILSSLLLVANLAMTGCTPHVASKAGVPARNATPLEKALAYNAGLADANRTLAGIVRDAASQPSPLIEPEYAGKLLVMQARVADFDRTLTPLLADAGTITANAAKIEQLLDEIKAATQSTQQDLGIKNADTQKKVGDAIGQVYQFADLALEALKAGGLLK